MKVPTEVSKVHCGALPAVDAIFVASHSVFFQGLRGGLAFFGDLALRGSAGAAACATTAVGQLRPGRTRSAQRAVQLAGDPAPSGFLDDECAGGADRT